MKNNLKEKSVESNLNGAGMGNNLKGKSVKNNLKNQSNITDIEKKLIIDDIKKDFERRKLLRKKYENKWQLNINFLIGNQYCHIFPNGDIQENEKNYPWQERLVFNHIAPIVESRCAKLNKAKPIMSVRPASDEDSDIQAAKLSKKIIEGVSRKLSLSEAVANATLWSEVCGTAFYKILWDCDLGNTIGRGINDLDIKEGDVSIAVCSPFEIFPDNNASANIDDCMSIIHAKAYPVQEIFDKWGVEVKGEDIDMYSLNPTFSVGDEYGFNRDIMNDHAILIEKYYKPTKNYPNGRLIIIAGDKLLFDGDFAYINREDGKRGYPFVKQCSLEQVGCFWGASIIERIIPIQKSFNALKNRKNEFLNKIAAGIVAVEDGSVDTDNLEDEGLRPGKILVYRQGSTPPIMMTMGNAPVDFLYEEDKLIGEFSRISGVSELMTSQVKINNSVSGIALQLLIEQDELRLSVIADNIKFAMKNMVEHVLRLYKQYATHKRLLTVTGEGGEVQAFRFSANDITSFDIVFQSENELVNTPSQRKVMVVDLLKYGLLQDEGGSITDHTKAKVLDMFGFGDWENAGALIGLHIKKAAEENLELLNASVEVSEIDDHKLHITEHTRNMLSNDYKKEIQKNGDIEKRFLKHIRTHKELERLQNATEITGQLETELPRKGRLSRS